MDLSDLTAFAPLALVVAVAFWINRAYRRASSGPDVACKACEHIGAPRRQTRGSFAIEVVLWLCIIVPGLIYSLWRLTTRHNVCQACGSDQLVPLNTPAGQRIAGARKP